MPCGLCNLRQFDWNEARPAHDVRAAIGVRRCSGIGDVINERFQNQKKFFGKHGEVPPLQLPVMNTSYSVFHL
jgi:hypothetical protein